MKKDAASTARRSLAIAQVAVATTAAAMLGAGTADAATGGEGEVIRNGTIGYVLTERYWAVYETKDKVECPNGFNDGPREEFAKLFPDNGHRWTLLETQLRYEGEQWHPDTAKDTFPFYEAQGKISYGLNLDGKISAEDFESPEGEKGIDNQLYRATGCIANYRTIGTIYHFENEYMRRYNNNRVLIELTGVDDLVNDDDVTLTTYRGLDALLTDATGNAFIPGGTQRIDLRWGKPYIYRFKAAIVDGVLTTEPLDTFTMPWGVTFDTNGFQKFRGLRFRLKLTQDNAEGLMAGYVDVEAFDHHLNTSWATHHQSYGQQSSLSEYKAIRRLADGYPDPKTGENTAISSAALVKFSQVFIQHPSEQRMSRN